MNCSSFWIGTTAFGGNQNYLFLKWISAVIGGGTRRIYLTPLNKCQDFSFVKSHQKCHGCVWSNRNEEFHVLDDKMPHSKWKEHFVCLQFSRKCLRLFISHRMSFLICIKWKIKLKSTALYQADSRTKCRNQTAWLAITISNQKTTAFIAIRVSFVRSFSSFFIAELLVCQLCLEFFFPFFGPAFNFESDHLFFCLFRRHEFMQIKQRVGGARHFHISTLFPCFIIPFQRRRWKKNSHCHCIKWNE